MRNITSIKEFSVDYTGRYDGNGTERRQLQKKVNNFLAIPGITFRDVKFIDRKTPAEKSGAGVPGADPGYHLTFVAILVYDEKKNKIIKVIKEEK